MDRIKLTETARYGFSTSSSVTGAATNADSTPTVVVYEDGVAMGVSPTVANLSTGAYEASWGVTAGNGFEVGKEYVAIVSATVGGVNGKDAICAFTVTSRDLDDVAFPTVSGRSIDVDASGGVEITPNQSVNVAQWLSAVPNTLVGARVDVSVGAMAANTLTSSAVDATAVTEIQAGLATSVALTSVAGDVTTILADTNDIQTRLPATLVGGRMDSSVGGMQANTITSGAVDATAVTEIQAGLATSAALTTVAADVTTILADTNDIQTRIPAALVSGRMDSSTGAMAANVLTASALAADAVTEIQTGLATSTDAALILGLLHSNAYVDNTVHGANGTTSARLRIFASAAAANAATDGAADGTQGEVYRYTITTTYDGASQVATHKLARTL